ncbi:MAG: aldo/keto reductase, partial [Candidatus Limnocylindrales bacterium]
MTESKSFAVAADGVDPGAVPQRLLWTGARMPAIGLGTFGSDRFSGEDIAAAVIGAAEVGYRAFDCARIYGNEHLIGASIEAIIAGGIAREELFVTSKLWNDKHAPA